MTALHQQLLGTTGITPASLLMVDHQVATGSVTTYTFIGVALGTSTANRKLVIFVGGGINTRTVTGVTVNAVACTLAVEKDGSNETGALWYLDIGTGVTSANVVVTFSGAQTGASIVVWDVKGAALGAPSATGGSTAVSPATATLNIPAGGIAVGGAFHAAGSAESFTWAGLTEDVDELVKSATFWHTAASGAFLAAQTALTISATPTGGTRSPAFAIASWGPK